MKTPKKVQTEVIQSLEEKNGEFYDSYCQKCYEELMTAENISAIAKVITHYSFRNGTV